MRSRGFAPISDVDARVLVLGSLPGQLSLQKLEYYAQPRNGFWKIMAELFGASPRLPYAERTAMLVKNRIALWDVCAAAHRPGSLDSAIRDPLPNDFAAFLDSHPQVALICFNGAKAAQLYARMVRLPPGTRPIRSVTLPSTSPAHAAMPYPVKLARWSIVRSACEPGR